ncbi:TniQ family protein [Dactylosporangium sp. NPDC000244]|uniref:TniQ family protein n=1 Tax=Dactylosporangium sp. NPDC000244 TaxID=3154365 RepID=UPI0033168BFB
MIRHQPTIRPLPRPVAPVQDETMSSFLHRLAARNHVAIQDLTAHVSTTVHEQGRRYSQISIDSLAAASGLAAASLAYALPEIREQHAHHRVLHLAGRTVAGQPNFVRLACRRCMASKAIAGPVQLWARHDHNVCLRHRLWIGEGVHEVGEQLDVSDLPEIGRAQSRHRNLVRRHGHRSVSAFYETAHEISDWSSRNSLSPTPRSARRRYFFKREQAKILPWSYSHAAHYPEVVGVLSVLASPFWRRLAISAIPADWRLFLQQVGRNGITNGDPATNAPLRNWMVEQRRKQTAGGEERGYLDPPAAVVD